MLVTILVPCHDEAEAVGPLFDALEALPSLLAPHHFPEIICVDDGSTDGTPRVLQARAARTWFPVRILGCSTQRGLGAAIREGAPLASGEVIVTYDADRAYPVADIPRLVDALADGVDAVTASPWHPSGTSVDLPPHRTLLSRWASRLYGWRLGRRGRGLHTFTCGFRAYRKEVLLAALPRRDGFTATAEILLNVVRNGGRVVEVPSALRARTEGTSKMRVLRTALAHLGLLLRG